MFSDAAKKAAFNDAQKICTPRHSHSHNKSVLSDSGVTALSDAQKDVQPGIHTATTSPRSDTAKKIAFGDAHKTFAPQLATEKDIAAFSDAHKKSASADTGSPDKSVCIGMVTFNDTQISRTLLRAQEKQAFREVATFSDARKKNAPSCSHSPGKSMLLVTWQRSLALRSVVHHRT